MPPTIILPGPGLYQATGGRIIKILYSRSDTIHYWEITDLAKTDSSIGKLKNSMPLSVFSEARFVPFIPTE